MAAFDAAYTDAIGTGATPPSFDDVTTIWPGSPDASMRGTNAAVPMPTPNTFTPKHQRQSFASCCQGSPPPPDVTPAFRNTMLQRPCSANTDSASAPTEPSSDTSVGTPRTGPSGDS